MKCINELKKIGVEQIASKTRITQDKVQNILDLNYGVFNKTHARGFTQIIEREFGVNMSEWMEALEAHSAVQEEAQEAQKDEANINIPIESTKKDKTYIILSALLAVLVAFFIVLFAYNNFIAPKSQENAESSLDSANAEDFINVEEQDLTEGTRDLAENPADSMLDSANVSADSAPNDSNATSATETKNIIIPAESSANEIIITPNEPLWVGIIDLKTHKKQQFSLSAKRTINLEGDKIIRTGHSFFTIDAPNFNRQFLGGEHKYLIFKTDSGVKELTKKEFLELNKGAEW